MATITCGWSLSNGQTYVQTSTYSSDGTTSAARFTITSVTYDTSTNKITINGNLKSVVPSGTYRWDCAAYAWFIDGTQKDFWHGGSSGSYSSSYWRNAYQDNWGDAMNCSQTVTQANTYTIKVKGMYNGGYRDSRWESGSWCVENSATLYIDLPNYELDVNGWLDGQLVGNIEGYGTVDVYINNIKKADDATDFCESYQAGSSYTIDDIKSTMGHTYNGAHSGNTVGILSSDTSVALDFTTNEYLLGYNGNGGFYPYAPDSFKYNTTHTLADAIQRDYTDVSNIITISYNANGGINVPTSVNGTTVDRTTYSFKAWALNSTSGTQYNAGASYTIPASDTTFYALWNTSGPTRVSNPNITISSIVPTRSGYDFLGWATTDTATSAQYQPNTTYQFSNDTVLYAVWRETKPSNLQISGNATGPFSISLNWSADGLNISNYTIYYNGQSKDCGVNTTTVLDNLTEETSYTIYFTATNPGGTITSDSIIISTPADQAKIRIKKNNQWVKGKTYFKKNGQWVKAKKIYIKKNGRWVLNKNDDQSQGGM